MTNNQSKLHRAEYLYLQTDLTQQEIVDLLSIDRKTLYNWARDNNWKRAKYAIRHAPGVLVEQYLNHLGLLNSAIAQREDRPYPTLEEAEIIRKLTVSINHTRRQLPTLSDHLDVFTDFACALRLKDGDVAKKFVPYMDAHIQEKLRDSNGLDKAYWTYIKDRKEDKDFEQYQRDQEYIYDNVRESQRRKAADAGNPHLPFVPMQSFEDDNADLPEDNTNAHQCADADNSSVHKQDDDSDTDSDKFLNSANSDSDIDRETNGESSTTQNAPGSATGKDLTINDDAKYSPNREDREQGNSSRQDNSLTGTEDAADDIDPVK